MESTNNNLLTNLLEEIFTETEHGINIEANNINVNCITSKDNKFNLDQEGNLSVKSISTLDPLPNEINYDEIFDLIYPIGSIYLSVNNVNPSLLFNGSWTEWGKGRVPTGVDTSQNEFNLPEKTGGSKTHTLSTQEMPKHKFTGSTNSTGQHGHQSRWSGFNIALNSNGYYVLRRNISGDSYHGTNTGTLESGSHTHTFTTNEMGNNQPHNNLQPYITCYMWKRVS